jgi:MSHA biogenesis protein MshE
VLAQRLVRTVCGACSAPQAPDAHHHAWLRQSLGAECDAVLATNPFRHGSGCEACNNTGYSGRSGVYEFIEMTQELVEAMNDGDPARFTQAGRRQMAGRTLRRDALRLALAGRTTLDEAMRVGTQTDD